MLPSDTIGPKLISPSYFYIPSIFESIVSFPFCLFLYIEESSATYVLLLPSTLSKELLGKNGKSLELEAPLNWPEVSNKSSDVKSLYLYFLEKDFD